jgi:PKD repeat protein
VRRAAFSFALVCLAQAAHAGTPPQFVSTASTFAIAGQAYAYDSIGKAVAVGDPTITYSAPVAPAGFSIDGGTGAVSWTPASGGDVPITLQAQNGSGSAMQSFTVHVVAPAAITSTPTATATTGQPYHYGSDGSLHASGDAPITFSVSSSPAGFVVDAQSGKVTWTPSIAGSFPITVRADNPYGGAAQSFTVTVGSGGVPPQIAHDANASAAVGVPYVYSMSRAISLAAGDAPVTFAKLAGPPELFVDAQSGAVAWIPTTSGSQSITVRASNLAGSDDYAFTVNVASGVTAQPTASAQATPLTGDAPLAVGFDGSGSAAAPGTTLIDTSWDFGDGSPPSHMLQPMHTYLQPGAYTARLTVTDDYGETATAEVVVSVTAMGQLPPQAQIGASALEGSDLLAVQFTCNCSAGTNPIATVRWDFGDGSQSNQQNPMHTFVPGSYNVRLTVADTVGLSSQDSVLIIVKQGTHLPPLARAYGAPPSGPAPLAVSLLATAIDLNGAITDVRWDFGDGTGASAVDHVQKTFAQPGTYEVKLVVTADSGLTGTDSLTITVTGADQTPPEILSVPSQVAWVGVPYKYSDSGVPQARGSRPITWSLGGMPPANLQVHSETGQILWTPTADQVGEVTIVLNAANGAATASQTFTVEVRPASEAPSSGCGVAPIRSGGALPLLLLLALAATLRRRTPNP